MTHCAVKVEIHLVTQSQARGSLWKGERRETKKVERGPVSPGDVYSLSESEHRGVCFIIHNLEAFSVFQNFTKEYILTQSRRPGELTETPRFSSFPTQYLAFPTGVLGTVYRQD